MKKTIKIEGMHCGGCVKRIEKALGALGDVTVKVDLEGKCATVESANDIADSVLKNTVEDLGFDVVGIEG